MNNRSIIKTFMTYKHVFTEIAVVISTVLLIVSVLIVYNTPALRSCNNPEETATTTINKLTADLKPAILKHIAKPDTALFDVPVVSDSDAFIKMTGHFTSESKHDKSLVDFLYVAAYMRTSTSTWKLVHLDVNGDIIIHTLE